MMVALLRSSTATIHIADCIPKLWYELWGKLLKCSMQTKDAVRKNTPSGINQKVDIEIREHLNQYQYYNNPSKIDSVYVNLIMNGILSVCSN